MLNKQGWHLLAHHSEDIHSSAGHWSNCFSLSVNTGTEIIVIVKVYAGLNVTKHWTQKVSDTVTLSSYFFNHILFSSHSIPCWWKSAVAHVNINQLDNWGFKEQALDLAKSINNWASRYALEWFLWVILVRTTKSKQIAGKLISSKWAYSCTTETTKTKRVKWNEIKAQKLQP